MRNFWTPELDEELNRHKATGLSATKIAALLQTTRGAVLGRSYKLRNKPSQARIEQLKRQRIIAAEAHKNAAEKRERAAAEKRDQAQARQNEILAAMQADVAAGVDQSIVIKRAIGAGAKLGAVAKFFGLPRWRVYEIVRLGNTLPQWTDQQVELLLSMWPDHSAQKIADALGTTRGAVLGKIWRIGLRLRKSENGTKAPGYSQPTGSREAA